MTDTIRNDDVLSAGNSLIYRAATSGVDTTGWCVERGEGPTGRRTWLLTSPRKITETANFIDLGFKNADAFERIRELYGELEEKGADAFAPSVSRPNRFRSADTVSALLGQLAGAASTCWDNLSEAGNYMPDLALEFVKEAEERLREIQGNR